MKKGHSDCAEFLQLRKVPKTNTSFSSRIEVFSKTLCGINTFGSYECIFQIINQDETMNMYNHEYFSCKNKSS